ncbi:MAG: hypothetical protein K8T90_14805 [Planctomycetes bacterium]|nr:hypothetical protein [Planctomycetota bacterium]
MRDPRNLAILVLACATAFLAGTALSRPESASAQQAGGGAYGGNTVSTNGRVVAATGTVGSGMSVLWLMDTETKRLLVYGTNSLGKNVELRAARNITWDLALDELNDDSQYKAEDLKRLAEKRRREQAPQPVVPGGPKSDEPK